MASLSSTAKELGVLVAGYIASVFMGLVLGMIGGGGSILTVPILVYLFSVDPVTATAYSLFIVGLTALVGGSAYLKTGEVDFKTGILFALPSFVGVYLVRAFLLPSMPETIMSLGNYEITKSLFIMIIFSLLMLFSSISMIKQKKKDAVKSTMAPGLKAAVVGFEGLIVGGVTGLVGAGGGFLIIPALVVLVGLPMKVAVGTSLFIIASKSLIGFIGDLQYGPAIDWPILLSISLAGAFGIFFGKGLAARIPEGNLKKGFGYFVLVMGTIILFDQFRAL